MKQLIYYVCVYFSAADDTDDTDFIHLGVIGSKKELGLRPELKADTFSIGL